MAGEYISADMRLHNAARMLEVVLGMFESPSDMKKMSFDKYHCVVALLESAKVDLDRMSDELLKEAING